MTTVRFDLIDEAIAWAESEADKGHERAWRQDQWSQPASCGTAYCIAGHVVALDGWRPVKPYDWDWVKSNGETRTGRIDELAIQALGLSEYAHRLDEDDDESEYDIPALFESENTLGNLKRIRDRYANAEGVPERYSLEEKVDRRPREDW